MDSVSPIEARRQALADYVREAPKGLTAGRLIGLFGPSAHTLAILVLALLNMIPGPPGYGGTIALTMMGVTLAMLRDAPIREDGFIGRRTVSRRVVGKLLERLHLATRLIGRVSRPRLHWLVGERARRPWGVFVFLVCLPMIIPIPFINAVPNVGIAVMAVSRVNGDGAGVIVGALIALLGLALAGAAIWGVTNLAQSMLGW